MLKCIIEICLKMLTAKFDVVEDLIAVDKELGGDGRNSYSESCCP